VADGSIVTGRATPGLDRLEARFRAASPVFRETIAKLRAALGDDWAAPFDETVIRMFPGEDQLAAAVEGYSRFALDVVRLQLRFEKERAYLHKSYAEVTQAVYANETYMQTCYLPGLLLSHFLWPHHYRQMRFFEQIFVGEMVRTGAEQFYDIGPGTGFYSRLALMGAPGTSGTGFDISPSSQEFSERHVRAFGAGDRYQVELRDVVERPPAPVKWLICVEVLEHLEDPVAFLAGLRRLLSPGGKAFITAALNAPNADHIYLYRTAEEVKTQLLATGFAVEQYFCALAGAPKHPDVPVAEVAAFIVS
jgi:2-polyprenyl-3-methyl-5-hydroxy-6-metoxy-1,4-benzoquinol methylase